MKIRILSDLHIEFSNNDYDVVELPSDKETTLVLAGDIGNGITQLPFIEKCLDQFKYVVYVFGNHDFWGDGRDMNSLIEDWRGLSRAFENLYFLENEIVILDGVRFIGGVLWTDMDNNNIQLKINLMTNGFPDFYEIIVENKDGDTPYQTLTPDEMIFIHDDTRKFIFDTLGIEHDGPTVVVTHFLPLWACIHENFRGEWNMGINGYFASNLEYIFQDREFDVWIHGHTHNSIILEDIYGKNVYANPRGYYEQEMNPEFDPVFTIDV